MYPAAAFVFVWLDLWSRMCSAIDFLLTVIYYNYWAVAVALNDSSSSIWLPVIIRRRPFWLVWGLRGTIVEVLEPAPALMFQAYADF